MRADRVESADGFVPVRCAALRGATGRSATSSTSPVTMPCSGSPRGSNAQSRLSRPVAGPATGDGAKLMAKLQEGLPCAEHAAFAGELKKKPGA